MPANITHHTPALGGTATIPKASYNENHDHTLFPAAIGNFTSQTGVVTGAAATSNTVTLSGETDLVWPITVRGDGTPTLQVNETGDWLTHANAVNGDTIRVRLTASSSKLTARTATLYIPGDTATFTATTADVWEPDDMGSVLRAWYPMEPLALSNNAAIATLTDASGIGHDLTNATSGERPTYKTAVLNGLAVAEFDGGDRLFTTSFNPGTGTGFALGAVYKLTANGSYPMTLVYKSNTGWEMRHQGATRQPEFVLANGATVVTDGTALATDTWLIRVDVFDDTGNTAGVYINGVKVEEATGVSSSSPTATENFYIGGRSDGFYMTGQIADAVMCNTLSSTNREKLEGYWAHRFGLTGLLDAGHPYKSVAP